MKKNFLGNTGLNVSRLCFGSLTMAPSQKNLNLKESAPVLEKAIELGVNFFDTADLYNNYSQIKQALQIKRDLVICTKSYDYTAEGVKKSLNRALKEMGRDYIDLYMLHEQESKHTFQGHWEAISYLLKMKDKGVIRAFGISTHRIEAVKDALFYDEIEVIFPIINVTGIGIEDGTREEMEIAIKKAKAKGKGIFGMKPLGGGNLLGNTQACFDYILGIKALDSIAFGMQTVDEVMYNTAQINGDPIDPSLEIRVKKVPRRLIISDWCDGCGRCVGRCSQGALSLKEGVAKVNGEKCVTCSYCASVCPNFCIKVI